MPSQILLHAQTCLDCGLCVRECAFLQKYGSPKHIAVSWQPENPLGQQLPFACNLCGLCAAVCPVGLNPAIMFLEMRQQIVERGPAPFPQHKGLIIYEGLGISKWYSSSALPKYCDTILFPGCTFSGTRPARLLELFQYLRQTIPSLGMVLSCCAKPSHDLGRKDFFKHTFKELCQALVQQGIQRVLVVCPSCHTIFSQYGGHLKTEYVYNLLAEQPLPESTLLEEKEKVPDITVHDPCTTRQDPVVHASIRHLLHAAGFSVQEMPHHGKNTLCCGEGGAVPFVDQQLAQSWGDYRRLEAEQEITVPLTVPLIVTYCAGCVNFLNSRMRIVHLLDLLFAPKAALAGKAQMSRPPLTYLNRLLLKRRLKKIQKEQEQAGP